MSDIDVLSTVEQWETAAAATDKPILIFKHSTRCPISAEAFQAWRRWVSDHQDSGIRQALVHVVEHRPVSIAVAEHTRITHASPQAILIVDGKSVWNTSHWHITYDSLEEHLREHCGK